MDTSRPFGYVLSGRIETVRGGCYNTEGKLWEEEEYPMKKKLINLCLAASVALTMATPALAAEGKTVVELIAPKYDFIGEFEDGYADVGWYEENYEWRAAIINTDGELVTPEYREIDHFSEGLAAVQDGNGKAGFIDREGNEVIPCQYGEVGWFSEGLADVCLGDPYRGDKYGYINKEGELVIPCRYTLAGAFINGLAAVQQGGDIYGGGKWGFIDTTGKEVIPCEYDEVGSFDENGLAWVGKYTGGSVTVGIKEVKTVKWGLIDRTGKEVVACKYKDMESFSEGLAAVAVPSGSRNRYGYEGRKWGFVDTKGKEVIPCIYSRATDFSDGLSVVMRGDADAGEEEFYGVIDTTGKAVIPFEYDMFFGFGADGYSLISRKTGKKDKDGYEESYWGLLNRDGELLTPPGKYYYVEEMYEGMAAVAMDTGELDDRGYPVLKYGFVDLNGDEVIPCQYDRVGRFVNGYAEVANDNDIGYMDTGLIDKTGKLVVPMEYHVIGGVSEGYVSVGRYTPTFGGGASFSLGFLDVATGEEVVPLKYGQSGNDMPEFHNGFATVYEESGEKCGLLKVVAADQAAEEADAIPAVGIAYPSTQTVEVDGKAVEFQCYALKDENGNDTNYIKLRDLADILNGTPAQFEVGWVGSVTITTGRAYTRNGSEQSTPFHGERAYTRAGEQTLVNGTPAELSAFILTDDNGGGFTYYKLRDLGTALGILVDWSAERGIFIESK